MQGAGGRAGRARGGAGAAVRPPGSGAVTLAASTSEPSGLASTVASSAGGDPSPLMTGRVRAHGGASHEGRGHHGRERLGAVPRPCRHRGQRPGLLRPERRRQLVVEVVRVHPADPPQRSGGGGAASAGGGQLVQDLAGRGVGGRGRLDDDPVSRTWRETVPSSRCTGPGSACARARSAVSPAPAPSVMGVVSHAPDGGVPAMPSARAACSSAGTSASPPVATRVEGGGASPPVIGVVGRWWVGCSRRAPARCGGADSAAPGADRAGGDQSRTRPAACLRPCSGPLRRPARRR